MHEQHEAAETSFTAFVLFVLFVFRQDTAAPAALFRERHAEERAIRMLATEDFLHASHDFGMLR